MEDAIYRFDEVEVDAGGRDVRHRGARVSLEPKALDVLLILLAEAGRVVDICTTQKRPLQAMGKGA